MLCFSVSINLNIHQLVYKISLQWLQYKQQLMYLRRLEFLQVFLKMLVIK